MKKIQSCFKYLIRLLFKVIPIKKQAYFNSFGGMYSDSPRYISESLHELMPEVTIIWETAKKSHEKLPKYIKTVKSGSISAVFENTRSQICVDNYMGFCYGHTTKRMKAFLLNLYKRKNQFSICTWHGIALKKINADEPKNQGKELHFYSSADVLTCGNCFMKSLYERQNDERLKTVLLGTPRNDILFNVSQEKARSIKNKLNLPLNKKILLFAPTFRDSAETNNALQNIDYETLLVACSERFGGDWIFVFRAHDSLVEHLKKNALEEKVCSGNIGDDMAEYLAVSDVLLTDYSSSMFDYLLTKRPCFLYCPDLTEYSTVERGLYFSIDELPFKYAESIELVAANIRSFKEENYQNKAKHFLDRLGNVEDGCSTQKIINLITEKIK